MGGTKNLTETLERGPDRQALDGRSSDGESSVGESPVGESKGQSEESGQAIPVEGLTCPNCGGSLDAHAGLRVVECGYCQTALLVASRSGARRLAVEPELDRSKAISAARSWLHSGFNRDRRLERDALFGEALLCFLPFYRVEADCIGIALGTEERTRTVGSGKRRRTERYEVDVERTVEKGFDTTVPALNISEWGVQRIQLHGDHLVGYEPSALDRLGMVYPPTGSEAEVRKRALEQFKARADPGSGLKRIRFRHLETLRDRLTIVYYPLWLVRYRFHSRTYQILIDGEDGSLAYGKAPGNDLYRALTIVGSQAVVLYFATTLVQLAGASSEVLGVGAIAVLLAMIWGWRKFRHGGVVVEGSGVEQGSVLRSSLRLLMSGKKKQVIQELLDGNLPLEGS